MADFRETPLGSDPISAVLLRPLQMYLNHRLNKKAKEVEIERAIQDKEQAKTEHEADYGRPSQLRASTAEPGTAPTMTAMGGSGGVLREPGLKERDVMSRETVAATGARGDPPSVANTPLTQEKYEEMVGGVAEIDKQHGTNLSQGLSSVFEGVKRRIGKSTPVDTLAAFRKTIEDPATKKKLIRSLELSKPQYGGGTGTPLTGEARAEDSQAVQEIDMMIESVEDGTLGDKFMPESAAILDRADETRLGKETMYPTAEQGFQPASIAQGLTKATTKDTAREDEKTIRNAMAKYFGYSDYQKMEKAASVAVVNGIVRAQKYYETGQYTIDQAMQKSLSEDPYFLKEMVEKKFPDAVEEPEGSGNYFVTDESGVKRPVLMRAQ